MINPIRLKGKPANIARYYTVGDYYTKGSEEHSEWGGKIAAELGLPGGDHVDRQGQRFVDRQPVIQVAGKIGDCGFARLGNV